MKAEAKYTLKKKFTVSYYILLAIGLLLTIGRWLSVPFPDFVVIHTEFHSHISNLALSMIFYLAIGSTWLLSGMKFRYIALLGGVIIAGNLICETLMGFMNTPDILDAAYGIIGMLIGFCYLLLTYKCGLIPIEKTK